MSRSHKKTPPEFAALKAQLKGLLKKKIGKSQREKALLRAAKTIETQLAGLASPETARERAAKKFRNKPRTKKRSGRTVKNAHRKIPR